MRLSGKRALVTGGAQGIGKGIVGRFLAEGANVIALDRNETELKAMREEFAGQAERLALSVCDLRDLEQLEQAAGEAFDRWQGIDIVINNAGIAYRESFLDIPLAHWDAVMDINVRAVFRLGQLAAEQMIRQGTGGSIVNMSSKNGLAGSSMLAHYNASKAGVILLSQSMAVELAPHGIRVNVVAPGFVETPLDRELRIREGLPTFSERTPMRRSATIDEVANVFLFLASDESSYVTGSTIAVDGGHLANASEF
ncbi:NAD(P)-dependent dehydrogenase, short-chain alcohol dehydrogenase family [Paenibacillus tianmuensis]|uniref:NAD(P)-dependent dehydrogenase, short-chain alcohol dehydrogenase family n=1 Tax=Paenibacillus tianmuensis TaxID=624147 RepID=A0A1G4T716_9BACL|nr:SDR family NAD(P)-dependent oxidoreductase [Paenibacillus tianmuensis]SCW77254.1 NAD(P)-dependent dehydrogenase, short-chain alcohol dehydrogenase family [Paenibacillus tianmuensis]